MTNYERLFREQMQGPEFTKAYHEAKLDRKLILYRYVNYKSV